MHLLVFAEAIRDDTSTGAVEAIWIVGLLLGFVLIAVALLRARPVPVWSPVLILVFVAIEIVLVGINLAETAGFALLSIGVGAASLAALREG
jgi:hypothetical protein